MRNHDRPDSLQVRTSNHSTVDDVRVGLVEVEVIVVADGGNIGAGGSPVVDLQRVGVPVPHHVAELLGVGAQEVMHLTSRPAAVTIGLRQAGACAPGGMLSADPAYKIPMQFLIL